MPNDLKKTVEKHMREENQNILKINLKHAYETMIIVKNLALDEMSKLIDCHGVQH